jgi:L-iditol 2-dehydrogenase
VIEAAGTPAAVEHAIRLARTGGRVVLLGLAGHGVTAALPIDDVVNNDLAITASFGYTSAAWPTSRACSEQAKSSWPG